MNFDTLSIRDYLILRAAAQKLQEKYESDLKQCPESMRLMSLESIIKLDLVILRCSRKECSFTTDECRLLIAAVVNFYGILSPNSKKAHAAIPILLDKLAAIIMATFTEREPLIYNKEGKVEQSSKLVICT